MRIFSLSLLAVVLSITAQSQAAEGCLEALSFRILEAARDYRENNAAYQGLASALEDVPQDHPISLPTPGLGVQVFETDWIVGDFLSEVSHAKDVRRTSNDRVTALRVVLDGCGAAHHGAEVGVVHIRSGTVQGLYSDTVPGLAVVEECHSNVADHVLANEDSAFAASYCALGDNWYAYESQTLLEGF